MTKILYIKAAEGGLDSKLFVKDLKKSYIKMFDRLNWNFEILDECENSCKIKVSGKGTDKLKYENGGHRIQRVPPTETRGRVHTSNVIVSVTSNINSTKIILNKNDLSYSWYSGSGAGGQHRNKHQNCLRLTHIPSGITVSSQGRKRSSNIKSCMDELEIRLNNINNNSFNLNKQKELKSNFGSGCRSDKTYTIRFQDNEAKSHINGKSITAKKYMKGYMDLLWN